MVLSTASLLPCSLCNRQFGMQIWVEEKKKKYFFLILSFHKRFLPILEQLKTVFFFLPSSRNNSLGVSKIYQSSVTVLLGNTVFLLVRFEFIYIIKCYWKVKKIKLNTQCVCNCMAILLLWLPHSMQFPSIWMFFVKLILCKWHLKWSFASIPVIPSSASARCNRNSMKKRNNKKKKNYKIDCGKVTTVHSGLNHVCVDTKSDKKRMLPPANQQKNYINETMVSSLLCCYVFLAMAELQKMPQKIDKEFPCLYSKTYQSGGEMPLPCNRQ